MGTTVKIWPLKTLMTAAAVTAVLAGPAWGDDMRTPSTPGAAVYFVNLSDGAVPTDLFQLDERIDGR